MPSKNTNIIGQLRGKHDPHYKLAARVDLNHDIIHGIEKKLTDLPKIHSTLSKSFGMQRKTLRRVMGLEGIQSSLLFRVIGLEEVVTGDARKRPKGEPEGEKPLSRKGPDPKKPRGKKPKRGRRGARGRSGRPGVDGRGSGSYTDGARRIGTLDGADGAPGASGIGSPGLDGVAGGTGGYGPGGLDGLDGISGADGLGGARGADGSGADGLGGADGFGIDGAAGAGGADGYGYGVDGAAGAAGADGRSVHILDGPGAFDKSFRRTRISTESFTKGTPYTKTDAYAEDVHGITADGEQLTPQERKKRFLERRKKITADRFKRGTSAEGAEKVAADTTGTSDLVKVGKPDPAATSVTPPDQEDAASGEERGGEQSNAQKILKSISSPISTIADTVDSIFKTIQDQYKEQQDTKEDARIKSEEKEVKAQEKSLEKGGSKGKGLGGKLQDTTKKLFKPFTGILERLKQFFVAILAGKVLMPLLDWFGDPANADKVTSLFRFVKDWWPVLVAGLIAFLGPSMISLVGVVALLMWGVPKIVDAVKWVLNIPSMIGKLLTGGGKDLDKAGDDAVAGIEKDTDTKIPGQDPKAEKQADQTGQQQQQQAPTGGRGGQQQQQVQPKQKLFGGGKVNKYEDGGKVKDKEEDRGGVVEGPKGKDRVPAMLTDGEFVMSRGAVQEYGADTLAGMNAAAGGTNKPDMVKVPHFSGGGMVGDTPPEPANISSGSDGASGSGSDGASGSDGSSGSDGASGSGGESGKDGKDGKGILGKIWGAAQKVLSPQIRIMMKLIGGVKGMITNIASNTIKKLTGGIPKKKHIKLHNSYALKDHTHKSLGPASGGGEAGKPTGIGRMLAGAADAATGGFFDFDKQGGGGADLIKKAKAKISQIQKGGANITPPASNESKVTIIQQDGGGSSPSPEPGGSNIPAFPVVYPARKSTKQKLLGITV